MKMTPLLGAVALALSLAPAKAADAAAEVDQAFRAIRTAVDNHDAAALDRSVTDDFMFILRSGNIYDKKTYLARVKDAQMIVGGKTENEKIRVYGNAAIVTDLFIGQAQNGTARILGTHVFVKQAGTWKLASVHACNAPSSPAAKQ